MLELAPGTWWGPEDATVVTAPPALVGGDARLREELAAEVARVRLAGRACLVLLGDDPAPTRDSAGDRAYLAAAAVAAVGPDDVAGWLTMRDPLAAARAAGGGDVAATLAALHHLLLGHGVAADALREAGADVVGTVMTGPPLRAERLPRRSPSGGGRTPRPP